MHKILYIGNFDYPHGNAAGNRVYANGHLFRESGHEVSYLGLSKDISGLEYDGNIYEGFQYLRMPYPKGLLDWASVTRKRNEVIKVFEKTKPTLVIFYGNLSNSLLTLLLARWCQDRKIIVVHDVVDWLPSTSKNHFRRILKWADTEFHKRFVNLSGDGVIAISSYLENYYSKKGKKVVVIPPLSNDNHTRNIYNQLESPVERKGLVFAYAGYPFDSKGGQGDPSKFKDRLDIAIDLFSNSGILGSKFEIYGITRESYLSVVTRHKNLLEQDDSNVFFHGPIQYESLCRKIAEADFIILYRDKNIGTEAGFPSKVVESISMGTAVITTATSDLGVYVGNGVNGYILGFDHDDAIKEFKVLFASDAKNRTPLEIDSGTFSAQRFRKKANEFVINLRASKNRPSSGLSK